MRNLTDLLEGLLDADYNVSENDLPVSIIKRMLEDKADYMKIYNKIMFDLNLPSCRVPETRDKSFDHAVILLHAKNMYSPKISIFTRLNSKCWSGVDIISVDGNTKYSKTTQSIYKPPTNSRNYVARLLPKDAVAEFQKVIVK